MQLRNNTRGALQFNYPVTKNGLPDVEYIHIPAGATVIIEDAVWTKILAAKTPTQGVTEVLTKVESENPVLLDKKDVVIKDYELDGNIKYVSLAQEMVKAGDIVIVERAKVSMAEVDKLLASKGIDVAKMAEDAKLGLYDELA